MGLLILFLASSCSDFLEEEDNSNFTEDNFFQTEEQADAAINNLYAQLRFVSDGSGTYGESPFMMLEFPTGLATTEVAQSEFNNGLRNLNTNSENNHFLVWWENSYEAIANANLAIENIPEIENMSDDKKNNLIGQAKFMRAFHYYNLVRLFGDIPLIVEPLDANSDLLYPGQSPQADIYELIVTDLTEAEEAGLPLTDNTGRASEGAVKSLLASVYLTMAGHPLEAGDDYYKKAADKAKEVIDDGGYELFDDYDKLHDPNFSNSGEFIFQNNYLAGANITSGLTAWLLPNSKKISQFSDEYGVIVPTRPFINSHENGDKRTQEKEFYYSEYPKIDNPSEIVHFSTPYIYKYFDEDAVLNTAQSELNWTFMRYAEVLLIYAEAGLEAYGPTDEVLKAVNQIRRRAELPDFDTSVTKEDIWTEKFHELAFENKYWFDMIRRRKALNVETGKWENFTDHQFTYGPSLSEKYLLFAIPQREIDNNKDNLEQNPGW